MSISLAASEGLAERAATKVVMEVLGKVLLYISASPRNGNRPNFRTIRLGDIKLIKEFKEMRSNAQLSVVSPRWSVVGRQTPRATVRRVYKAKLEGRESGHMTVAVYEGDGAEETWNEHLTNYESIRHPNIIHLYGLEATSYIRDVIGYSMETSVWIRPSTGQLCLDLAQGGPETSSDLYGLIIDILRLENVSLDTPDSEDIIISSLSEDQYHELCSQSSIARFQYFQVSTAHAVGPGIFQLNSQCGTCVSITEPLQTLHELELHWNYDGNAPDELLPNSWIRYDFPRMFALNLELNLWFPPYESQKAWLAQANHIFAELQELDYVEDYVCIYHTEFMLRITDECDIPEGYLFVCPPQDFHTGTEPHANLYQWPACPAYWSLNPSGADRLSTEDARNLGFPVIHIETLMFGESWDRTVYRGLRRFHEGKGFDLESREVARQLGYPLFEVASNRMPFLARAARLASLYSLPLKVQQRLPRRRNGMEATVPPVQLWNHRDAAASGSSVDPSLGLIAGGVPMMMRSVVLMAGLVNAYSPYYPAARRASPPSPCTDALHAPKVNPSAPVPEPDAG
ncbi:hypothetical protein MSAN_01510200 [Mycena sanguinolenta]|uniref:Protein kinase domain-containing protein n=1 Tax=Mycena sanguinolenta TaxID=230812 RepID=A0A8H6Y7E9_9AGAR|nr:hypothetical protein MSAN_01510200 [Mycena sanguinolenta]